MKKEYLDNVTKYGYAVNVTLDPLSTVHIQNGNDKLGDGIYTLNLMPGTGILKKKDGTPLCNVPGTCKGCGEQCENSGCYAMRDARVHFNTVCPSVGENTLLYLADPDRYFSEIETFLKNSIVAAFRWHSSGEIPDYNYLEKMAGLAAKFPRIDFYVYTKRFNYLEQWQVKYGRRVDEVVPNLVVNVSIWHKNYSNPYGYPEFIFDDGTEPELKAIRHCPAYDKDGNKTGVPCSRCQICKNQKPGEKTAAYDHVNKGNGGK